MEVGPALDGVGGAAAGARVFDRSSPLRGGFPSGTRAPLAGLRVLELGAGTGVAGMVAAALGARVVLTDVPEALAQLQHNVDENWRADDDDEARRRRRRRREPLTASRALGRLVRPCARCAGASRRRRASESLYVLAPTARTTGTQLYAPLVRTLADVAPTAATTVLLANLDRRGSEPDFFRGPPRRASRWRRGRRGHEEEERWRVVTRERRSFLLLPRAARVPRRSAGRSAP